MPNYEFRARQVAVDFCNRVQETTGFVFDVIDRRGEAGYAVNIPQGQLDADSLEGVNSTYQRILSDRRAYLSGRAAEYEAMSQQERLRILEEEDPPIDEYLRLRKVIRKASGVDALSVPNYVVCRLCSKTSAVCTCRFG